MRELYVYYRAPVRQADAVHAAVTEMQSRLRASAPGLQARLLRRIDGASGVHTWMESYALLHADSTEGINAALGVTIEQLAAAWSHLLDGARHTEVFDACA